MSVRPGINWSVITPELLRPAKVEKAVREAGRLRELETTEKQALIAASAELERAEADDVAALAASFRSGAKPEPRTQEVEKARASLHEHQRRVQAAAEALTAAEAELGQEVQRSRTAWQTTASKDTERVRQECRDTLASLRVGLERLATLRGLDEWLQTGMAEARALRERGLLSAPSSRHAMANGNPVGGDVLLRWVEELIAPTESATSLTASSRPDPAPHAVPVESA